MITLIRKHVQRNHGERGASLIIALVFITVFSLLLMGLSTFSDTNVRAAGGYRSQRATNYATDAALDAAVNRVRHATGQPGGDPWMGRDPALYPTDTCNESLGETVIERPAEGNEPEIVVSCVVVSGSGSGEPADLGGKSPYALLTLGDRRTDALNGAPSSLGVRNTEPAPFNGNVSTFSLFGGFGDPCPGDRAESGMRLNRTVYPWVLTIFGFPIDADCAQEPNAFAWNVRGDVFSNSKIVVDTPAAVPTMVNPSEGAAGTIKARGGCVGSGFGAVGSNTYCSDAGWDFADGLGQDPGWGAPGEDEALYKNRSISGLTVQSVPPASECTNSRQLVTFSPGIYTDATALNALFGNASCKNATFWFTPGAYYFDFRNTTTSYQCGTDQSNGLYDPSVTQVTQHQWCIGGAGNDYGGQRVIGGTPFNWSPTVDPVTHVITLVPAKAGAGPGTFFGLFPQPTQFTNGDNCPGATTAATLTECGTVIEAPSGTAKTVNYAMSSSRSGSSIWLSNFPDVPRGSYNSGIDLEVSHAAINRDRMNAPSIQVDYTYIGSFGIKTTGTCGPYTLDKPPASGALEVRKLSAMTNGATMAANLSACLNTGDKINSATVRYNANRPLFQGSPYATAKLDGARLLVTAQDQPTFPRPPAPDGSDPGGDCDPEAAGVQFIFGGDSRVYVPNGGLELCAGPNPANPGAGQQIALYGVPAAPRLVPTSASGGTNPNNAKIIAEGSGLVYATMGTGQAVTLSYPGYTTPAGYSVSKVEMRASFDASSAATVALQSTGGTTFSGSGCSNSVGNTSGVTSNPVQTKTIDVTACLTASNRLASAYNVRWQAGGSGSPKLDGVEFIVTLTPTNENTTVRPGSGCITASPNLWYGTGSPDCSMVRVDGPIDTDGNLLGGIFGGIERRGRLSIKGSIYAPSASVDIDDEDVWYPIASRGIVARHLRLRGFQYHDGYNEPAFNNWLNDTPAARSVVFLACRKDSGPCTPSDESLVGRASVSYAPDTSEPQIQAWSLGRI